MMACVAEQLPAGQTLGYVMVRQNLIVQWQASGQQQGRLQP